MMLKPWHVHCAAGGYYGVDPGRFSDFRPGAVPSCSEVRSAQVGVHALHWVAGRAEVIALAEGYSTSGQLRFMATEWALVDDG